VQHSIFYLAGLFPRWKPNQHDAPECLLVFLPYNVTTRESEFEIVTLLSSDDFGLEWAAITVIVTSFGKIIHKILMACSVTPYLSLSSRIK
jgi:hypothetical protein